MKKILLMTLLIMSLNCNAKDICENSETQGEYIDCLYTENLNPIKKLVDDNVETISIQLRQREIPGIKHLLNSNEAWKLHVENECQYLYDTEAETTSDYVIKYNCLIDKYKERLSILHSYTYD